jgi:predicted RNA methylase
VEFLYEIKFDIPSTYKFHKKSKVLNKNIESADINVVLVRVTINGDVNK